MAKFRLIVGLGNPGARYQSTRHNLGRMVARSLGEKENISFKKDSSLDSLVAIRKKDEMSHILLLPETFMNLSGRAVKKACDKWKIECEDLLVILDEASLPFGQLRLREKGGTGGHKGLASIQESLGSSDYPRLRMGIGLPEESIPLENYVLQSFSEEEKKRLPDFIESGVLVVKSWCEEGIASAQKLTSLLSGKQ